MSETAMDGSDDPEVRWAKGIDPALAGDEVAEIAALRADKERLDRLHLVMHHLRRYDWNKATPELTRAAIDLAWKQLPAITRRAHAGGLPPE